MADQNIFINPEEIESKFRSKYGIYKIMRYDMQFYLPFYNKLTVNFCKDILSKKKLAFRNYQMNYVVVPKYLELGVNKIWNYIRELPELMQYFPDYDGKSLPERQYMWDILYTLKPDIVADLIKEARRNRRLEKNDNHDQMIEIAPDFWDEISTLVNVKDSRGRAPYLLKKITKPRKIRENPKHYMANYSGFVHMQREEEKGNDED